MWMRGEAEERPELQVPGFSLQAPRLLQVLRGRSQALLSPIFRARTPLLQPNFGCVLFQASSASIDSIMRRTFG